jgi:eukaryotic-like serine/threonine-protein kinase
MSATLDDPQFSRYTSPVPPNVGGPALLEDSEGVLPRVFADRFRLYAILGQGSLAVTYRALDLHDKRVVAVKLYAPGFGVDPSFRHRFLEGARRLGVLAHPGLVRILGAGEAEGQLLRELLQRRGRLPIYLAVRIAAQLADALEYLHSQGIVHGDVRPENVFLDDRGRARLADVDGGRGASAGDVIPIQSLARRAAYQAPEQVHGELVGFRTDVYALGVLAFEMLVGAPPTGHRTPLVPASRRRFTAPPYLRGERPDVCWGLEFVIRQALAPEPRERQSSAAAFRAAVLAPPREADLAAGLAESTWAIRAARVGTPPAAQPPRRVPQVAHRRRDWQWPWRVMPIVAPILGTLVVVCTLAQTFDLWPALLAPLQVVLVPDVQNKPWAEAEEIARVRGLEVVKARPEPCDDNGRDFVIRQDPGPGRVSHRSARLRLTACSGLRVPSVVGQREEQARVVLAGRDWPVADVRTDPTAGAPAGTIVAQEPSGDLILPDKRPLVLTISQGPR